VSSPHLSPNRVPIAHVVARREASAAISDIVEQLEPMRTRLALIGAKARHVTTRSERAALQQGCLKIQSSISEARTLLLLRLMDAPAVVSGHSRVLDVERAIDSLERCLIETLDSLELRGP
jgi:hypothetical protein